MKYHKGYQLSVSSYDGGAKILHIARDASGVVRFREPSQEKLTRAIDRLLAAKKKAQKKATKLASKKTAKKPSKIAKGKTNKPARKKRFWG